MLNDLTIKQIQELVDEEGLNKDLLNKLKQDPRKGVKRILQNAIIKEETIQKAREKSIQLMSFENKIWAKGYEYIGGIDEAGRGPLAGPLVSACVILPKGLVIEGIDDSKKLSASKRQFFYNMIKDKAISIGLAIIDPTRIDEINIYKATLEAMQEAVYACNTRPQYLLIDAMELDNVPIPQESIISGDSRSQSIAAASIIAKVTRDRIMNELSIIYPEYGFEKHKGYGTKAHIEAIKKLGLAPVHRRSFTGKFA